MRRRHHEKRAMDVGPYLLGTLTEAEARDFERHLLECVRCREELERLRPAAEALPRSVEPLSPPPGLKASVMDAVAEEAGHPGDEDAGAQRDAIAPPPLQGDPPSAPASRWRPPRIRLVGTLAGVIALLLGLGAGFGLSRVLEPDEVVLHADVDRLRAPRGRASVTVPARRGDVPRLSVRGMPKLRGRRVYEVWLKRGNSVVPQSLFEVSSDGSGTAGIPDGLDGVDAVLVTRERAGGTRAPTGDPLLTVRTE